VQCCPSLKVDLVKIRWLSQTLAHSINNNSPGWCVRRNVRMLTYCWNKRTNRLIVIAQRYVTSARKSGLCISRFRPRSFRKVGQRTTGIRDKMESRYSSIVKKARFRVQSSSVRIDPWLLEEGQTLTQDENAPRYWYEKLLHFLASGYQPQRCIVPSFTLHCSRSDSVCCRC